MIYLFQIITVLLTLCCSSTLGWTAERFPFLGEVTSDKVSIRAGFNVNFERLDIVPKGTSLIVLDTNYDWYKVQLPASAKAYVRVDYVKVVSDKVGQISADRLNIRAGRGVNFSAIGQLNKGAYVRLVSKFDDWFQIEPVEGLYGWISKDFLKVKSYSVPSLAELGLTPVTPGSPEAVAEAPAVASGTTFTGAVTVNGVIEAVPAGIALKNIQYQFTTDENAVYYLKIDPAVVKNFTHKAVRLEGDLVTNAPESLPHSVLLVKKFTLVP